MPTGVYNHEVRVTHGFSRKGKVSPEYRAYHHAKDRCRNPKDKGFKYYGGRRIEFRFQNFEEFIAEVGKRPSKRHSLDRKNNDGHYEIGNVRWVTRPTQMKNRRSNGLLGLKRGKYAA